MKVETGPIKFGTDWTGLFLRGEQAVYFGTVISTVLSKGFIDNFTRYQLESLAEILGRAEEGKEDPLHIHDPAVSRMTQEDFRQLLEDEKPSKQLPDPEFTRDELIKLIEVGLPGWQYAVGQTARGKQSGRWVFMDLYVRREADNQLFHVHFGRDGQGNIYDLFWVMRVKRIKHVVDAFEPYSVEGLVDKIVDVANKIEKAITGNKATWIGAPIDEEPK